ncbi:hypothetical protein Vadar_027264 [Vaccinium darrowii]|uniref:Uncharacterized protein n=1 Tax=Vaccinium darrowii TaxID=229202 RepID=A0ACB7YYY3_9ERIC|nr:hypothetical protein Vadar_027264 [Vaccinium darrowii]
MRSYESKRVPNTFPAGLKFPPSVTRLTLQRTLLKWEELSLLQTLPSLEVLKLLDGACCGPVWDTSELEEGFSQLKYLCLKYLDIEKWEASEDQFPLLEVLRVGKCPNLEQIPMDFANIMELRELELWHSSCSAEESARKIQVERKNKNGDDDCLNLLFEDNGSDHISIFFH